MDDRYLTSQLIAYIGNKRALIPFLRDVFIDLHTRHPVSRFSDPFAGSGAVSRLGKSLGFSVYANDWELYSYIINSCHIAEDKKDVHRLFPNSGGLEGVIEECNRLPPRENGYISTFYAPKSTESADYRRERLFYTRENGVFIDTVREEIEKRYPGRDLPAVRTREKQVLLAALLYQAATHANTSGVFKAFHKGFGGHGGDALSRITRPMRLLAPVLIDGERRCFVTAENAATTVEGQSFDLCYLDPPYNQHQYGSNYHLLNTIARWDKPPQPLTVDGTGRLLDKGGIRKDWNITKSEFCYKNTAVSAFRGLVDRIDARYIVLSYNTEGIMPYGEILDLLEKRGNVSLYSSEYITYRGGRQSISRKTHNVEFLLVCSTAEPLKTGGTEDVPRFFLENKIRALTRGAFYPDKIQKAFSCSGGLLLYGDEGSFVGIPMEGYAYFTAFPGHDEISLFSEEELSEFYETLLGCAVENKYEECGVLLKLLDNAGGDVPGERKKLEQRFVRAVKKIAHKKYIVEYSDIIQRADRGKLYYFREELDRIREIAEKRFAG
jgi:adenine-specific DNA-methyltransferase